MARKAQQLARSIDTKNGWKSLNLNVLGRLTDILAFDTNKGHFRGLCGRLKLSHHVLAMHAPFGIDQNDCRTLLALQNVMCRTVGTNIIDDTELRLELRNVIHMKRKSVRLDFVNEGVRIVFLLRLCIEHPCCLDTKDNLYNQNANPEDKNVRKPTKEGGCPRIFGTFFDELLGSVHLYSVA